MDNTLSDALLLMFVGMTSVFTVLTIVVTGGTLLIKLVNSLESSTEVEHIARARSSDSNVIQKKKVAAITAVVAHVTNGKGHIDKISKI
jgi:Na+-transporting methylmalonyl-CoA/oxaloacetate decarboxylase gamma subunit